MLELRRLRLLRELHRRGTIAAVADALQFTPSAISQQLAMLEREAGVQLIERAGRGVRLTVPGMVLAGHAERLLEEVARAEADLAAVAGTVSGRGRIASFQSGSLRIAIPAMSALMSEHPDLRCELVTAEPEQSLLALSVGDVDLVIGDEWQHAPWRMPDGLDRVELLRDPVVLTLPASDPLLAGRKRGAVRIEQLSQRPWISGPAGLGWDEITERICRERGGFAPQIRHRSNDAVIATRLVAHGLGVALLPMLALSEDQRIAIRTVADERPIRRIHAVTRAADSRQPSIQAMLDAVKDAAASLRR